MRGKVFFITGLAVGYVFGTRAGRKRYEQLKSAALAVWSTPPVQQGMDAAKNFAFSHAGDLSDAAFDAMKKVVRFATNTAQRAETVAEETVAEAADVVTQVAKQAAKPAASKRTAPTSAPKKPAAKKPAAKKPASAKPSSRTSATGSSTAKDS